MSLRGMVRGSHRTRFTSPALVHLLAQLTDADVPPSQRAFSERLGEWLGWTDAISLAAALNEGSDGVPVTGSARDAAAAIVDEAMRVRDNLARAITEDFARKLPARVDAQA